MVKNLPAMPETRVQSLGWEDPWRRERLSTLVFLPGESHGQRSPEGYSPWGQQRVGHDWVTNTFTFIEIEPYSLLPERWKEKMIKGNLFCNLGQFSSYLSFCRPPVVKTYQKTELEQGYSSQGQLSRIKPPQQLLFMIICWS